MLAALLLVATFTLATSDSNVCNMRLSMLLPLYVPASNPLPQRHDLGSIQLLLQLALLNVSTPSLTSCSASVQGLQPLQGHLGECTLGPLHSMSAKALVSPHA